MKNCIRVSKQVQVIVLLVLILSKAESFTINTQGSSSLTTTITHRTASSLSAPIAASVIGGAPLKKAYPSQQYHHHASLSAKSPLFHSIKKSHLAAVASNEDNSNSNDDDDDLTPLPTYGGLLGRLTGLSMTAIRRSVRTTTGLSLTAVRTTLRGLTGVSVNASLKTLFGVFPPWFRYFLQPFFILYYTPLMICKYFIGSTKNAKKDALASHEKIVEGWKDAIKAAELAQDFWPLHVTDDGKIESLTPQSVPVTDIIVESLDIASTVQDSNDESK